MKICPECNAKNFDTEKICNKCGSPILEKYQLYAQIKSPVLANVAKVFMTIETATVIMTSICCFILSLLAAKHIDTNILKVLELVSLKSPVELFLLAGFAMPITLTWYLPMMYYYCNKTEKGIPVGIIFKICTFLFISRIAGILMMFCTHTNMCENCGATNYGISRACHKCKAPIKGRTNFEKIENVPAVAKVANVMLVISFALYLSFAISCSIYLVASVVALENFLTTFFGFLMRFLPVFSTFLTRYKLFVFAVILALFVPFSWLIPMTTRYCHNISRGLEVGVGLKVCTLIFIHPVIGILMLCDNRK